MPAALPFYRRSLSIPLLQLAAIVSPCVGTMALADEPPLRVIQVQQQQQPARGRPAISGQPFTNLVPLTQLREKYNGFDGGLYGGGSNQPPETHARAARAVAAAIV